MDRIATLQKFIDDAPDDPFPRYGLALEHANNGDHDKAWERFNELLERFPDYLPTYLMAGGTLVKIGRPGEAADVYRRGIAKASEAGDGHTKGELEGALAEVEAPE